MLSRILGEEGFDVTSTTDGAKAISMIEDTFYELVLLDIKMPKVDGMEVKRG